jgi:hypothetical protein
MVWPIEQMSLTRLLEGLLGALAQDNVLSATETSKSYLLESMKAWTATTKKMMSDLPSMPGMSAFGEMVAPMGMVSMTYDFAEKVLASQRSFVEEMVEMMAPVPAG